MVSFRPTVDVSFSSTVTAWSVLASRSFEKETMSPLKQKTPKKDRPPLTSSVPDRLRPVDEHALRIPRGSGLLPCLYVPVAARSISAIETYVGKVIGRATSRPPDRVLLVESYRPAEPDPRLLIWNHPEVAILHNPKQVWVDIDYRRYRSAFKRVLPDVDITGLVLDHVLNRNVARINGFKYVRIVPVSRSVNSSHGSLNEQWGMAEMVKPERVAREAASKAMVQYADIVDLVKMLNMTAGGSFMQNVNDFQALVDLPKGEVA